MMSWVVHIWADWANAGHGCTIMLAYCEQSFFALYGTNCLLLCIVYFQLVYRKEGDQALSLVLLPNRF